MSFSLLTPSRTVLMISDEALYIYILGAKGVRFVEAVPWSAENFENNVATVISKDCGGRPVLIVNDMVEQHYRKEKVPRVSPLDKQNVLQRKLKVAFPSYPVRAALPLKEKIPKSEKNIAGSVYIFAAIPASEGFQKTMGAAQKSLAPIAGFCLLPVEGSDMVKKLGEKLTPTGGKQAKWTVFMGQSRSGGLRQIVTKNGELALTRMTPVVENDEDPVLWANEVHQEFKATMSYLTRFGFEASDGLNVVLVANHSAGELIQEKIDTPCNFYPMTAQEVADILKISIGNQDDYGYADPIHVAWTGKKSKFILPMKAKAIDKVSKPRQVAVLLSFGLLLGMAFQGYQIFTAFDEVTQNWEGIEDAESKKNQLDAHYQREVKKKADLGFDIQLIQSALAVRDELDRTKVNLMDLFYNIGLALGRDMRIDHIELEKIKAQPAPRNAKNKPVYPLFTASMQMTFPSTTDAEKGNKEVENLQAALQVLLKDHTVSVSKLLEDYEYSEEIVVESGDTNKKAVSQDFVAEITIEGPQQ